MDKRTKKELERLENLTNAEKNLLGNLYSELFGRLDALPCVRILRVLAMNPRTAGIRRNHNRDLIPPVNGVFLPGRIEVVLNHYQVSER